VPSSVPSSAGIFTEPSWISQRGRNLFGGPHPACRQPQCACSNAWSSLCCCWPGLCRYGTVYVPSDDREAQATRLGGKENACSEWNLPPCVRSDQSTTVHWIRVSLETFPSVRKLGRSGLVVFADHQTDRSPASKRSRRARVARWEIDLATTAPRFGLANARSSACAED
jgi:hypothetical protein